MTEPKGHIYADSSLAVSRLVEAGVCISVVPEFLTVDDVRRGDVEIFFKDWELDARDDYDEWPPNAPKDGIVRVFVSKPRKALKASQDKTLSKGDIWLMAFEHCWDQKDVKLAKQSCAPVTSCTL